MGKRKSDQPTPPAQDQASPAQDVTGSGPAMIATPSDAGAPPATEGVKIEAPERVPSPSIAAGSADSVTPLPPVPFVAAVDAPKAEAPQDEAPQAEAPRVEASEVVAPEAEATDNAPPVVPPKSIVLYGMSPRDETSAAEDTTTAETTAGTAKTSSPWLKMRRVTPLAASIAIAAAVGAMAGSATTAGVSGLWANPQAPAKSADVRPLHDTITRLNSELAALKASIENSGRTSNAQFTKLGDRLERVERGQAEPAAKLTKLTDAVDRIEHRTPAATSTSHDVTGAITAPATQPGATSPTRPGNPPILDGWFVRGVYNGAALIQTRYGGIIEVERGDNLPGLGRIENIRRQDGRWVVVTSRGMIVTR
jgi:hypothetical protein